METNFHFYRDELLYSLFLQQFFKRLNLFQKYSNQEIKSSVIYLSFPFESVQTFLTATNSISGFGIKIFVIEFLQT